MDLQCGKHSKTKYERLYLESVKILLNRIPGTFGIYPVSFAQSNRMSLKKDIDELLQADVISQDTADRIRHYYEENNGSANHRIILIFGILGALLSGMGVILIMAYNWIDLTTQTKTIISFLPLLIAQMAGLFTLWQRRGDREWQEGSGVAIFMAMGACLFLISQIFHYPGAPTHLMLTWMLLILVVPYVMDSGATSLLYLIGITWYASSLSYFTYPYSEAWNYWWLLLAIIPYYVYLTRNRFYSFITTLHHWVIPISLLIILGGFTMDHGIWMYFAYFSLLGLFFILGNTAPFNNHPKMQNGYYMVGQVGTAIMLIMLSFKWFWKGLPEHLHPMTEALAAPEFWIASSLTLGAGLFLILRVSKSKGLVKEPFAYVFLLFIACFLIGTQSENAYILINILILIIGIYTIRKGNKTGDFTELNFGLLIFTILIFSRFFDSNISFLLRGLAFILVGAGFFFVNYSMYRKKIAHEK